MVIAVLPANTIRAIGSSQVLTDPCSVVKELVDNALDAQATSVFVEISVNTLDVIQVKDNGSGIGPEDREMVCRRYCTSKIRKIEELKDVGGRSLGFRGEALASAAEISSSMVVTTRIEGEAVAVGLKIGRNGEVEGQERASHPVGTTVRVVDFLKHFPVRRQTTIKACVKTLAKIKQTLQAYAIARPAIRLSLKVLKAKSDKSNWMYAPKIGASVPDAAMKVVDKTVAGQCQWISWDASVKSNLISDGLAEVEDAEEDQMDKSSYRVEAFLPRINAEPSIISHVGQFVSIDSRPVSCTRGILKQLIALYKNYIRSACPKQAEGLSNPFLCLNIVCPAGSYDVNVEPAKDDVLFEDPNRFLLALESFFISFYGELPAVGGNKNRAPKQLIGTRNWRTDFELLLAKRPKSTENPSSPEINIPEIQIGADEDNRDLHRTQSLVDLDENHEQAGLLPDPKDLAIDTISNSHVESYNQNCPNTGSHEPSPGDDSISDDDHPRKRRHTWRFNMYGCDEEDSDDPRGTQESPIDDDADTEEALRDINVSNPWIIAKMNAPVHPKPTTQTGDNNDVDGNNQLMTPTRDAVQYASSTVVTKLHTAQRLSENTAPYLPTPQRTLPSSTRYVENSSPPNSWHFPSKAWAKAPPESDGGRKLDQARDRHIIGALDRWVQKSAISGQRDLTVNDEEPFHGSSEDGNGTDNATRQQSPNHTNDFISARALQQQGTPLSQIPEAPPRRTPRYSPRKPPQQGSINKLFVSPVNDPHRVWFEIESSNRRTKPSTQARSKSVRDAITATTPISFPSEDEDPMDDPSPLSPTAPATNPNGLTLEKLMDYEHRKHAATQAYKASLLKQSILTSSSHPTDHHPSANSPHRARYEAAKAALAPPNPNDTDNVPQSVFADSDPRAYLLRVLRREDAAQRQGASAGQRPRRAKTSMLPLETIAADEKVQDLVLTIATDSRTIRKLEKSASTTDAYVCSGAMTSGLQAMIDDIRTWEQNLSALILHTFTTEGGEEAKMSFDLWPPLQAHMATHTHD